MTFSCFSHSSIVCLVALLPNVGCAGSWSPWEGGLGFHASRIPEIVIGETTREQIHTMFGQPNIRSKFSSVYQLTRSRIKPHILLGLLTTETEVKTLLMAIFGGDGIVIVVRDSDPGAVESLEQLQRERRGQ